ncbi:hypothetical protein BDW66DRAFT_125449 [Aspergillus desertorum]
MTPCFGQIRQIDIILRAFFANEWKMKFAQAWVIEFEQRSKGLVAGFDLSDHNATRRTELHPMPYPLNHHKTAL